jgi:hypothetical protein
MLPMAGRLRRIWQAARKRGDAILFHPNTERLGAAQALVGGGLLAASVVGAVVIAVLKFPTVPLVLAMIGAFLLGTSGMGALLRRFRLNASTAAPAQPAALPTTASDPGRGQWVAARLTALRAVEEELRAIKKSARRALDRNAGGPFNKKTPEWDSGKQTLSAIHDWQELYVTVREAYEAVKDTSVSLIADSLKEDERAALEDLEAVLDIAIAAVAEEIDRSARL